MNNKNIVYFIINLLVLIGLIFLADKNRKINSKELTKDSRQSIYLGYYLATEGTHSMDGTTPSNFREPIISVLNAINIWRLRPGKNEISKEDLVQDPNWVLEITKLNLLYLLLIYWLVYRLSRKLGLSHFLSTISSFIPIFFFSIFTSYLTSVNSELPSAILLLLFSLNILNFEKSKRIRYLVLSGLLLGLLALTKAVFLYLFILLVPFILIFDYFFSKEKLFLKSGLIVLLLASFTFPVGSWMLRNYIQMGTSSISDRGGEVLLIRTLKNQMNEEEYWGAFYAYAPEALQTNFFEKILGYRKEDLLDGGKLQRLNRALRSDSLALVERRFNDVKSYLRIAQIEHRNLISLFGDSSENANSDESSKSKAISLIISHPFNHLKASVLFGWRGIWFYRGRHILPVVLTFFMYSSLFVIVVLSLLKRNKSLFLISVIPILYFLFHAFLTHFIPRYSGPLIPILSVYLIFIIDHIRHQYLSSIILKLGGKINN